MKLLLLGAGGQVGTEIRAAARDLPDVEIVAPPRADADLSTPNAAADAVIRTRPDVVINAAAWTAVDNAERAKEAAFRINAAAAGEIAEAAARVGARLVHLSTDYVFSGSGDPPLTEEESTGPLSIYGESKLEGERLVLAAHSSAAILRTSWVYSAHGVNFVKTMLRLSEERDEVRIVADQIGGPTPASAIASAALAIASRSDGPSGTFHFQGAPAASWADFAEAIFDAAGKKTRVVRIKTADFPTPAKRPLDTRLNCSKILQHYGLKQPDWRADLAATVAEILRGKGP